MRTTTPVGQSSFDERLTDPRVGLEGGLHVAGSYQYQRGAGDDPVLDEDGLGRAGGDARCGHHGDTEQRGEEEPHHPAEHPRSRSRT